MGTLKHGFPAALVMVVLGCSGLVPSASHPVALAPYEQMPREVRTAPEVVRDAYRFAVANPEVLTKIPCYCGCNVLGHRDNYECYVEEVRPDGSVKFTLHALT